MDPEEGELFLASPAVKNYHINRNLFLLDDHKVLWKKSGRRERFSGFWRFPRSSGRKSSGCVMTFQQPDTRG